MRFMTDEYFRLLTQMYKNSRNSWGSTGTAFLPMIEPIIEETSPSSVLDYGSGTGSLQVLATKFNNLSYSEYDPLHETKSMDPSPADLVLCIDVLEHVELQYIDQVIEHIRSKTLKGVIFIINVTPAHAILPDGRNAHITLFQPTWWREKITKHFNIVKATRLKNHCAYYAEPKNDGNV